MYSHANAKHAKTSDDSGPDDVEEPNESWNEVTCYCGKPFAGRPMVECSKCLTWVHLKCAGLRRTHIPDTWHCSKCKTLHKSEKVSGSRKRKSTKIQQNKKDDDDSQQVPLASSTSSSKEKRKKKKQPQKKKKKKKKKKK